MSLIITSSRCLSSSEKGQKNSGLNRDLNPDLCDAAAASRPSWEQVIMWVNHMPVDVEIDDDNTR